MRSSEWIIRIRRGARGRRPLWRQALFDQRQTTVATADRRRAETQARHHTGAAVRCSYRIASPMPISTTPPSNSARRPGENAEHATEQHTGGHHRQRRDADRSGHRHDVDVEEREAHADRHGVDAGREAGDGEERRTNGAPAWRRARRRLPARGRCGSSASRARRAARTRSSDPTATHNVQPRGRATNR